jgi:hypothetical protein
MFIIVVTYVSPIHEEKYLYFLPIACADLVVIQNGLLI